MHHEWPAFKFAFTTMVIDSNKFSDCEKLRLLKDALKEPADDNLKDLQCTDGNFTIAWDRMTTRYDSPRESAHAAVKPLLELPPLMSQTGNGLYKLVATVRTTRAQIQLLKLGKVTEAEVLYTYHILTRLDARTIKDFNQFHTSNDIPTLDSIMTCPERQAKTIDLIQGLKPHSITKTNGQKSGRDRHDAPSALAIHESKVRFQDQISHSKQRGRSPARKGQSSSHQQRRDLQGNGNSRHGSPHFPRDRSASPGQGRQRNEPRSKSPNNAASAPCAVCASTHHRAHKCHEFLGFSTTARRDWTRSNNRCFNCLGNHSVKDCTSQFTCVHCKKKHHSLLHVNDTGNHINTIFSSVSQPIHDDDTSIGLMPTAIVKVFHPHGGAGHTARVLLDSGAEKCFITASAVKRLGLPILGTLTEFIVAGGNTTPSLGFTTFRFRNNLAQSTTFSVRASVLPQITASIPTQKIDDSKWLHLQNIPLADPTYNQPGPIDILLGTTIMDVLTSGKKLEGVAGTPSAYFTELGYVVQGKVDIKSAFTVTTRPTPPPAAGLSVASHERPLFQMQQFWDIEELPARAHWTPEEQAVEDHFVKNTVRLPNGRFQIKWPFSASPSLLGSSYQPALRRWLAMERRLQADPKLANDYHGQIEDYIKKGHLEPVPAEDLYKTPHFYIPHHAVFKASSTTTKIRIVFDASAKSSSGRSVNAILSPGPVIQAPLFDQLLRFRFKSIAMTADIVQMYRQISVAPSDRDFARIIYGRHPKEPLQYWRHTTVPFGFAPAPFEAVRCVHQVAKDEGHRFPLAAHAAVESLYVDDFLNSEDGVDAAVTLVKEMIEMLATAQMELRKWSSNSSELMTHISDHLHEPNGSLNLDSSSTIGTLGMQWNPRTDRFNYQVTIEPRTVHTKRSVLSDISKMFDPLGLVAPVIITAKILMQRVWTFDTEWDDPLPSPILEQWLEFSEALPVLQDLGVPRWIGYTADCNWELLGFCDASEKAYGACIFLRARTDSKYAQCCLVASKTRVAPVRTTTIRRLELQGCVLLADLMAHFRQQYQIDDANVHYWTDSTICLHWIHSHPSKWKIYVANRVSHIQDTSSSQQWAHVISEDNPGDCCSRGLLPHELATHRLWWSGPAWLAIDYTKPGFNPSASGYDSVKHEAKLTPTVLHAKALVENHVIILSLSRLSSWTKAVRVLAILQGIGRRKSFKGIMPCPQASVAIASAELSLIRIIQMIAYPSLDDAIFLQFRPPRFKSVRLQPLHPFKDQDGIFRVGGRLQKSNLPPVTKNPALLPCSHPLVRAIILYTHAGRMTIHNHLRQKFWIPNALKSIKAIIHKCLLCFRYNTHCASQLMGQLPSALTGWSRACHHH